MKNKTRDHSLVKLTTLCLLCLFGVFFSGSTRESATKGEWPQWLGPHRNGISLETGLLKSWPATGPKIQWRIPLGDGYSGVAISKGKVFTLFSQGDNEFIVCLEAKTGKEIWRVRSDSTYKDVNGNGPRSTPTIHGDVVYALSAHGKLYALQTKNGGNIWSSNLREAFDGVGPSEGAGYGTSPLIEEDMLLVETGSNNGKAFVALNKKNGRTIWQAESDSAAFASPVAITVNGMRQIVFFSAEGAVAVSPQDGKSYWRLPWKTSYNVNAATPLFVPPDKIFISSGYETGATLLRIKTGAASTGVEAIWKSKAMQNIYTSSVLLGEYLYGFDKGTLKCIEANTGVEKWKQRGFGVGTLIYADGHLIVLSDKGKLALVEAIPTEYKEKASAEILTGRSITVPALANGKLYLRNMKELVCVDLVN